MATKATNTKKNVVITTGVTTWKKIIGRHLVAAVIVAVNIVVIGLALVLNLAVSPQLKLLLKLIRLKLILRWPFGCLKKRLNAFVNGSFRGLLHLRANLCVKLILLNLRVLSN